MTFGPPRPRPLVAPARRRLSRPRSLRWRRTAAPDLPLGLELLARELRGGATLARAITTVAASPTADPALRAVVDRVGAGSPLTDELDRWCDTMPDGDGELVRAVLQLGLATGAALADALDRAASTLRERGELRAELRALTSQSRASAVLLAVAPLGFLVVLATADPSGIKVLISTPLGWACLGVGVALDALGLWWMSRLVDAVVA